MKRRLDNLLRNLRSFFTHPAIVSFMIFLAVMALVILVYFAVTGQWRLEL